MSNVLDFEKNIVELESKIAELKKFAGVEDYNLTKEIAAMEDKAHKLMDKVYHNLTPWQKVQIARHEKRPQFLDYVQHLVQDFTPLAGDRKFGEDQAIVGGLGRFAGYSVVIMGHQKGIDLESRIKHNFGCARPEGYRKAARLMDLANQFRLPILSFVNTSGAYPGIDAEERGQAEAIARSIETCLKVEVPIISTIIGEGGSGGAIAIAVADTIMMLENSIYSVISPEGCASILWKDADKKEVAAAAQKITAQDLYELKVIDQIIPEKVGGAHRHPEETILTVGRYVESALKNYDGVEQKTFISKRQQKFLQMGRL
ncbi:MAG: acetyl-CoA carboxylase carboxyltransferase subunit alpha [Candidatus Paracaedibacteraceae bacterium]|nr:acetyl-CoA carboxylase carboxyltransferase subunit alpha [Candidatus Paracaedibacteraceae bacterium]